MVLCARAREGWGAAEQGSGRRQDKGAWLCFGVGRIGECSCPRRAGQLALRTGSGAGRGAQRSLTLKGGGDPLGFHSSPAPPTPAGQPLGCSRGADPTEKIGDSEVGSGYSSPTLHLDAWNPSAVGASLSDTGLGAASAPSARARGLTPPGLTLRSSGGLLFSACCLCLQNRRKTLTRSIKNKTKIRLYW